MFDSSTLARQYEQGEEVYISFQYYNREIEADLNSLIAKLLSRADKVYLYDTIESVVREFVQNSVKANMKRVYFKSRNLDIMKESDYEKGMLKFREVAYNPDLLKEKFMASGYRTVIKLRDQAGGIGIEISNNVVITPGEKERINFRIRKAAESRNFTETYENMYDATEGAGLGIILAAMLLKNAGIDPGMLDISTDSDKVRVRFVIPAELKSVEITSVIKDRILNDVRSLPTFPENVLELQAMCGNPDTRIDDISSRIILDPSLTADVLKLSNSAGFITGRRIRKINEAVMVIGFHNLNSILMAAASRKILDKRYRKFEQIWDHCNRTAYIARFIAMERGFSKIADSAFISGLLHDIGKIVLLATDVGLVNQIADMVENRKIRSSTILEEVAIGISHSTIGALIAELWNFPEELTESIRYHHAPLAPGIKHRDLVMIVYLANHLCHVDARNTEHDFFETEVLERFNLRNRAAYDRFYSYFKKQYLGHYAFLRESQQ